jgi:hypothetical protein
MAKLAAKILLVLFGVGEAVALPHPGIHDSDTTTLRRIYKSLQYQDYRSDITETWRVLDEDLIRDLVSQLLRVDAIIGKGCSFLSAGDRKTIQTALYENRLTVICRRRYFDDQIGSLEIGVRDSPDIVPIEIEDWVYLSDLLGTDLYERLKTKDYRFASLTRPNFDRSKFYYYDILLHFLNPEVTFWSLRSGTDSRWSLSAFSILGDDYLDLPFWFKGTVVVGGKITFFDSTGFRRSDRNQTKWSISVGWEGPINFRVDNSLSIAMTKGRKLVGSGQNIHFGVTYVPSFNWPAIKRNSDGYLELGLTGSLKISEKRQNDFSADTPTSFYSVSNSVTVSGKLKHLFFGVLDLGGGISWHDLSLFERPKPDTDAKLKQQFRNDHYLPFLELAVSKEGGLLQYNISAQVNGNASRGDGSGPGYGFFVLKSSVTLSNAVGFDFRYFKCLKPANLPVWQCDDYIVFSPVIRINY